MVTTQTKFCPKCFRKVHGFYLICPDCGKLLIGSKLFSGSSDEETRQEENEGHKKGKQARERR